MFFRFVTKHACDRQTDRQTDKQTDRQTDGRTDRQTDRQNYDPNDCATIAASRGKNCLHFLKQCPSDLSVSEGLNTKLKNIKTETGSFEAKTETGLKNLTSLEIPINSQKCCYHEAKLSLSSTDVNIVNLI